MRNEFTAASCWVGTWPSEASPFLARDILRYPRPRALVYCYFSVVSKGTLGVRTQRKDIDLVYIAREREIVNRRSNPEGQKELDLETQISITRNSYRYITASYTLQ